MAKLGPMDFTSHNQMLKLTLVVTAKLQSQERLALHPIQGFNLMKKITMTMIQLS